LGLNPFQLCRSETFAQAVLEKSAWDHSRDISSHQSSPRPGFDVQFCGEFVGMVGCMSPDEKPALQSSERGNLDACKRLSVLRLLVPVHAKQTRSGSFQVSVVTLPQKERSGTVRPFPAPMQYARCSSPSQCEPLLNKSQTPPHRIPKNSASTPKTSQNIRRPITPPSFKPT
jgi:hypothetical protein